MAEPGALQPGDEPAGYRIERFIAKGGMGEVYEATQLSLDRRVAFKLISRELGADSVFRDRFRREARLAASLDHDSILPVHESGETPDGRLFLAMRFVEGQDLDSYLKATGRMDPVQVVAVMAQVAGALDTAHEAGLVHRDVKPANVMLEQRKDGLRAYLTDFGLAKRTDVSAGLTESGALLGTVDYMAPEQIEGRDVDGRVDVYAFGCMLYRCLVGAPPYRRDTVAATLMAHASSPVPRVSEHAEGVPEVLDTVVQRAMEKNRDRRAGSAGALMRWAAKQMPAAPPPSEEDTVAMPDAGVGIGEPTMVSPGAATTAAAPSEGKFARPFAVLTLGYAVIWAATYLTGRTL